MKKLFQLMFVAATMATLNSCNQNQSCDEVNCLNGGVCIDGDCECPEGFSGPNCEISSFENGVFVVHEGNFQGGNASVSFLHKGNEIMANGVFTSVNGIPLGDVGQSMTTHMGMGYIVVNNSSKIEVVSLSDFTSLGTITGLSSPRYISIVNHTSAYVSDLSSNVIAIFNPHTLAVTGAISVNGQVEELVNTNSGLIAAGTGANQVYKINTTTNTLEDSVAVGIGPTNLVVDVNGKVWVMTNGGWGTEEPKLVRIDPGDMSVELSLDFTLSDFPSSLKTNATGNSLYWSNGGVFKMGVTETAIPTAAYLSTASYKVNADPETDMIYVSDAGDFNSTGKIYRYEANGTPVDTFDVGVIPGEFVFTE